MKPIIIFVAADGNTVSLAREKLESLISQAYEQGKADGKAEAQQPITIWDGMKTSPLQTIPYTPPAPYYNAKPEWIIRDGTITVDNATDEAQTAVKSELHAAGK